MKPDIIDVTKLREGKNKIVTCEQGYTLWALVKGSRIASWVVTDNDNTPLDTMVYYGRGFELDGESK